MGSGFSGPEVDDPAVPGIARIPDPRVWGTIVGAVGGSVFVLTSRGDLPGPWPTVALVAWIVAAAAYVAFVFVVPRHFGEILPVRPVAGVVYLASVAGMLALIRLGTVVLDHHDRTGLRPALIVTAVGVHFLPFAAAFHTPLFRVLGSLMVVLGCVGLAGGWAWGDDAADWAAVVAGLSMLTLIAADAAPRKASQR